MQHRITTSQRKFLLLSPLVLVVLATFVFWFLGGGQRTSHTQLSMLENFNPQIPLTKLDRSKPEGKLSYYKQADTKKVSWTTLEKRDTALDGIIKTSSTSLKTPSGYTISRTPRIKGAHQVAKQKEQLHYKLQQLEELVRQKDPSLNTTSNAYSSLEAPEVPYVDLEELEEIMSRVSNPQTKDPELAQLNDLLETVLDIQHPRRVTRRLENTQNNKTKVAVKPAVSSASVPISFLGTKSNSMMYYDTQGGFFGVADRYQEKPNTQNTIKTVVHQTQDVTEGSKVALRLDQEIILDSITIPKGHIIYAKASLYQERLLLNVDGIQQGFTQLPVSLAAYGTDGFKGIYIPGASGRETTKESSSSFLQRMGITPFNNTIDGQIARAGIQATKKIFSKKVKEKRVRVKAGDRVLLKYD